MKNRIGITLFILLLAFWILPWHSLAQAPHGINWSWNKTTLDTAGNPITVDGYNIYCSTSPTGPFATKTNSALITTNSFLQTTVTVGNTYYCQLTAVKGSLEGGHSATSAGVLFQFPPAAAETPAGVVQ